MQNSNSRATLTFRYSDKLHNVFVYSVCAVTVMSVVGRGRQAINNYAISNCISTWNTVNWSSITENACGACDSAKLAISTMTLELYCYRCIWYSNNHRKIHECREKHEMKRIFKRNQNVQFIHNTVAVNIHKTALFTCLSSWFAYSAIFGRYFTFLVFTIYCIRASLPWKMLARYLLISVSYVSLPRLSLSSFFAFDTHRSRTPPPSLLLAMYFNLPFIVTAIAQFVEFVQSKVNHVFRLRPSPFALSYFKNPAISTWSISFIEFIERLPKKKHRTRKMHAICSQ